MPDEYRIFFENLFGPDLTSALLRIVGVFAILNGGIKFIRDIWANSIQPFLQNSETKQQIRNRQLFAAHIQSGIERLNRKESWQDHNFTELEAEVEIDGQWHNPKYRWFPIRFSSSGRKREPSLSKALASSWAKRILLEGDPGSGKSVALRHIAVRLAKKAANQKDKRSLIPIYINLKDLVRSPNEKLDREFIKRFILESIKNKLDSSIERFIETEFEQGMHNKTWLFLFDSFDEIPEVLSSTETDNIVASYAEAIIDFLSGANTCRGILASRHFRGPSDNTFSKFQILPLSSKRITRLIRNSNLKPKLQDDLIGQLPNAPFEIREMAQNPMFLSLLCQHMAGGNEFPSNSHVVFESFILARLDRDKDQIKNRFNITVQEVRQTAENIAFAMLEADHLGLNPSRKALEKSIIQQNLHVPSNLMNILDALVDIRLAKSDNFLNIEKLQETTFSFVHRRFQEYFATSFLLRHPDRIDIDRLALDAKWRETMVVLLQTQTEEQVKHYLTDIEKILYRLIENLLKQINQLNQTSSQGRKRFHISFAWPPKLLHLLSLLQDGLASRPHLLAEATREDLSKILKFAYYQGILLDKKWAIEVASTIKNEDFLQLIRDSLSSASDIIQNIVYKQIPRLDTIPPDINEWIRQNFLTKYGNLTLYRERFTLQAYLARISRSKELLKALDILLFMILFNFIIHGILFLLYSYGIIFYSKPYVGMGQGDPLLYLINALTMFVDIRIVYLVILMICVFFSLFSSRMRVNMSDIWLMKMGIIFGQVFFVCLPLSFIEYPIFDGYITWFILYCIIWSYSCIYTIRFQNIRFAFFYPLIPVTLLLEMLSNIKISMKKVSDLYKYISIIRDIAPLILLIVLAGLINNLFNFLSLNLEPEIYNKIKLVGSYIFVIFSLGSWVFLVPFIYKTIKYGIELAINSFRDVRKWNNWYIKGKVAVSGNDLLNFIRSFYKNTYFYQIIYVMRNNRDIDNIEEMENVIVQLIKCIEYLHEVRGSDPIMDRDKPIDAADLKIINRILATPPFQPSDYRWIKEIDSRHLDQLTLFLEHLRRIKTISASKVSRQQS